MTPEERLIRDLRQALEDRDYQLEKLRRQLAVASARRSPEERTLVPRKREGARKNDEVLRQLGLAVGAEEADGPASALSVDQ